MEFEEARPFLERHHWGVVTTHQRNGAAQSSVVFSGAYQGHAAFAAVYGKSAKVRNLRRDPRCTVLNVAPDWRSWVTVEGEVRLFDYTNTETEKMRLMFRDIYFACGDREHPDWEAYVRAMVTQEAVAVLVRPDRVYGLVRDSR
jgi:PPOX class probable F420-dependent enzyme